MSDLTFGVKITADGKQMAGEVRASREELDKLGASAQRAAQQSKSHWAEQQQQANASAAAWLKGNAAADAAADKAWALANGYKEVGGQIRKSGTQSAESAGSMKGLGLNTQYARREMMLLGKEALTGDFSRMPRTFGTLVTHSNLLQAALSPVGIAIGATAAAAVGLGVAYAQGVAEMKAMNNAIMYTGNYAGATRGQIIGLAEEVSRTSTLTIGASKEIVTQLVSSGRIGAESLGAIAQMADTYAAATGRNIDQVGADLVKLFDDPAKGAAELNKSMHFLNSTELEYIDHLVKIGEEEQARLVLAEKFNASVPKHVEHIGSIEGAWNLVAKGASSYWGALKGFMAGLGNDNPSVLMERYASMIAFNNEYNIPISKRLQDDYTAAVAAFSKDVELTAAASRQSQEQEQQIKDVALARSLSRQARIKDIDAELLRLNELAANEKSSAEEKLWALEAIAKKQKELADIQKPEKAKRAETDPVDTAIAALQAEQFRKEMELLGVSAEQVKVYELAMRGADEEQLIAAQAAADSLAPLNAELEARKELEKQIKLSSKEAAAAQEESAKAIDRSSAASAEYVNQLQFENSLLGKSALEVQQLTEKRRIELALEKELLALRGNDKFKTRDTSPEVNAAYQAAVKGAQDAAEAAKAGAEIEIDARDRVSKSWEFGSKEAIRKYNDQVRNSAAQAESLYTKAFKGAEDAVTKFAMTGKLSIRDFAQAVIEEFYRIKVAQPLVSAGSSLLGSLFDGLFGGGSSPTGMAGFSASQLAGPIMASANGNVFSGAGISAYSGSVVDKPTLFPFARGIGLMGEAGPEAILPLTRVNGRLGVQAQGGAPSITVNVINAPVGTQVQQRQDGNGGMTLDVIVEQIEGGIARNVQRGQGALNGALTQTFGLNRAAGAY